MPSPALAEVYQFNEVADQPPQVIIVPEMADDQLVRHRAARFAGQLASQSTVEVDKALTDAEPHTTLFEAVTTGNSDLVRANVEANMVEIAFKAGFVTEVQLQEDENGHTHQYGQSLKSIQANNLLHGTDSGEMHQRSQAENRNVFRFESVKQTGLLQNHWFVTVSRTATEMTERAMDQAGFFTETMSLSIQATTDLDGVLTMESAFMAGVAEEGGERRDEEIVAAIGEAIGVDLRGLSATELLDMPLLIPKSLMPNGTIDLVAMGDEPFGTFFGQNKPGQDYLAYREACRQHRAMFSQKVDKVTDQLMKEAVHIKDEIDATKRLHELCGDEMVRQAVVDEWIDPGVFGPQSKPFIIEARRQLALGNSHAGLEATKKALEVADPRSCAFSSKAGNNSLERSENDSRPSDEADDFGPLWFKCKKGHWNKRKRAKSSKDFMSHCKTCGVSVAC